MFDIKEIRNSLLLKLCFRVLSYGFFLVVLYFLVKGNYIMGLMNFLTGIIFHLLRKLQSEKDNSRVLEGMIILMVGDNEEILEKVEEAYKVILEKDLNQYKETGE